MDLDNKKELTILINTLNVGGSEKNCIILCNELVMRNYIVNLWVVDLKTTQLSKALDKRVIVTSMKKTKIRHSLISLSMLLYRSNPQVLICFNTELAVLTILLKPLISRRTKIIYRSISTLSHELNLNKIGSLWRRFRHVLICRLLSFSDIFIAQSVGMKEDLISYLKVSDKKIIVIPNPSLVMKNVSIYIDTSIGTKKNKLVFVGRLEKSKGLMYLLDAFKIAKSTLKTDINLSIVGDGSEKSALMEKVQELMISDCVKFVGFQENVTPFLLDSNATVLTSLYEGFPNVLVESIAVGTPVISFDCPSGPRDIILEGVNGILVPYLDVNSFAMAIIDVISQKIIFDKQAVILSAKRFDLNEIINKYIDVISIR